MTDQPSYSHGMHMLHGVLVAQAPDSLEDESLRQFQSGLLGRVHATSPRAVIVDVSRVRLLDSISYALLADAGRMASMLGARVVFSGFQPGVVSTLMDLNVDTSGLVTAVSLEDAMELLHPVPPVGLEDDVDEEGETDGAQADADAAGPEQKAQDA